MRPLPVPVPDANTGNLILVTAGMEEGACCNVTDQQTCQIHACNRTSKLAEDRVLEQGNECGYVHRHNAGEGDGGGGRRREGTGGMVRAIGGGQDPRI